MIPSVPLQHHYASDFPGEFLDSEAGAEQKQRYENIQKFSEEARWLEQSEALQQARRKYVSRLP